MRFLKVLCGFACLLVLISAVWSMTGWNEARGVYDDVCYLRQAHLFQRYGVGGFDTDIARDDGYLAAKLKEIGFAAWNDPARAPCHTPMPATHKRVLQYPPGTGLLLALFPQGHQVIPLYVSATLVVFGFALLCISCARAVWLTLFAGAIGCLAIHLMVNPAKASYSMAPTTAVCAAAGYLTARVFGQLQSHRSLLLTALLGLLLGVAVNFRLPNLFLSSGYFVYFLVALLSSRKTQVLRQGTAFTIAYVLGMAPTLLANAINAGNPFVTTYGGQDVVPPEFRVDVLWLYATDMQFALLGFVIASLVFHLYMSRAAGIRRVALMVIGNLVVNLAFFMTHPLFTPYYLIPVVTLSFWTLLFNWLMQPAEAEAVDEKRVGQAAKA
jgi:hypothetical protein